MEMLLFVKQKLSVVHVTPSWQERDSHARHGMHTEDVSTLTIIYIRLRRNGSVLTLQATLLRNNLSYPSEVR